jgi:hypothetical protein
VEPVGNSQITRVNRANSIGRKGQLVEDSATRQHFSKMVVSAQRSGPASRYASAMVIENSNVV